MLRRGERLKAFCHRIYHNVEEIVRTYLHFRVGRSAAGLSYYLIMSLFPMIVCVSILVSQFRLSESDVLLFIERWVTEDVGAFVWQHTNSGTSAVVVFIIAMTLLVTSSGGAFRCLSFTAEEITGEKRFKGIFGTVFAYLFSLILFLLVYASIFVMVIWNDVIGLISRYITLPAAAYVIGQLRHLIVFAVIFAISFVLNFLLEPKDVQKRGLIPGTLFTSVGISLATTYFSMFIRGSTKYSIVYGSVVSIILMLIWVNMCGNILMIGVIINSVIHRKRK